MGRRPDTSVDPRRGLFLALESLAGTAALLLDDAGAVEHANSKACALLDCADQPALMAKWKAVAPLFELPSEQPVPPTPRFYKAAIPLSGGPRLLSLELRALGADAGGGYFVLLKDPAILDPLERELVLASERRGWIHLREALTHDLKGILNSMQISLELISDFDAETARLDPEQQRRARRITSLKDGLTNMDRALRLLPGAEGNAEPAATEFDVNELIKEVLASLRHVVRRNNVELELDLPGNPLLLTARRPWMKQALFDVAVHCLNAMRAGGSLAVEAAKTERGIVVRVRDNVADTAGGMDGQIDRTFGPGRGNGGITVLQVARSIIEAHGGTIELNSGVDGTEIAIRLLS